jgi:succinylglutamate desuccinylase
MQIQINKIGVVGGTHGNERTGVEIIRHWTELVKTLPRFTGTTIPLLANPEAVTQNRRYIQKDLNRCFTSELLHNPIPDCLEMTRALEINQILGPKGSSQAADLILDIHNSTANMAVTLIISNPDPFIRAVCAHLSTFDFIRIYIMPDPQSQSPYLPSISKRDICIEAGPQTHGSLKAQLFSQVQHCISEIFQFTEKWNQGYRPEPKELSVYKHFKNLDFPRDSHNDILAMIHPSLEGQDYKPLEPDQPLFMDFKGNAITYSGPQKVWPVFINEQAYYEKGIALSLTVKESVIW